MAEIFEEYSMDLVDNRVLTTGAAVVNWMYERLSAAGWPDNFSAVYAVINELNGPLLFSAILRSLRRIGRADLIEKELVHREKRWFAAKCIVECMRSGHSGVEEANNLRVLLSRSQVGDDVRLSNIIEEIANGRYARRQIRTSPSETGKLIPMVLDFEESRRLLGEGTSTRHLSDQSVVLLGALTMDQFSHLVELADPKHDSERGAESYVPGVVFRGGGHSVATRRVSYSSGQTSPGVYIRPAIVAANVRVQRIAWHEKTLSRPYAGEYVQRVLKCIAVSGNDSVLFDLLGRFPEVFIQSLGSYGVCRHLAPLIDSRIVPILASNVSAGTDEMLESLARLAGVVNTPGIDRVLGFLFKRWTDRFKDLECREFPEPGHHFWRAFRDLSSHPRFIHISDWRKHLAPVLYSPRLVWYHKMDVAQLLERDRGSFIQLENVRSKAQDWQHLFEDEIDLLDEACERLFGNFEMEAGTE